MTLIKRFLTNNNVYRIEVLFKIVYIIHLLASFNPYIEGTLPVKLTLVITMACGGLVLLCRIATFRLYCHTPAISMLVLVGVSLAIPSFFIYRYAIIDSVKTAIWMTFQFGLLFAFNYKKENFSVKKELNIVSAAILIFLTFENLVSVIMAFIGYFRIYQKVDGNYAVTGLSWWGRLYGVHGDPNYACVYTIAAIMIAVYFFMKYRKNWLRIILVVAAAINFMFVSFTASRTGLISLLLASVVFAFTYSIGCFKNKYRIIKSITAVTLVCVVLIGLNKGVITGFNTVKSIISSKDNTDVDTNNKDNEEQIPSIDNTDSNNETDVPDIDDTEEKTDVDDTGDNSLTIGRTEEEMNGDLTNRRADIWKSALQIFSKNPVFGIGYENVLGYAHDKMPTTYIVNNDQTDFDAFHNTVMDVLVSQGVVGILLAGIFAVLFVIYCIKRMSRQYSKNREELCLCLAICICTLASAMFLSHIFFVNIASTGIFWLFAGYLGYFLYIKRD